MAEGMTMFDFILVYTLITLTAVVLTAIICATWRICTFISDLIWRCVEWISRR